MAKLEVIGPKNKFFDVLSYLHDDGKLHIEDLSKKITSGEVPLESMELVSEQQVEREKLDNLLIRVRSIIKALQVPGTKIDDTERKKEYDKFWELDSVQLGVQVAKVVDELEGRTSSLTTSLTAIEDEMALLARYEPILKKIQPLAKQVVTTGAFDSVALLVERRYKSALADLKDELDKITNKQCEIVSTDVDEDTTAVIIVFNRNYSEAVHKLLAVENVNQIRLPSDFQDMPFDMAYEVLKERAKVLPEQLNEVRKEVKDMSAQWYMQLTTTRDVLADKIDEMDAIPKFGQTEYAFVVSGWCPVEDVKHVERGLATNFGDDVVVQQLEIDEHEFDETPIALKNPKIVSPFSQLFRVWGGMPKYGTVDPTWLMAIFYPLIFGMIVGDLGYGIIMLALVMWMRVKFKNLPFVQIATSIFGPAATMVIVFGILYGEAFGNILGPAYLNVIRPIEVLGVNLPFHRVATDQLLVYMGIAVAMGVLQIVLGLSIGVVNGLRTKHMKHVYEKGGMLMVLVFALLLGVSGAVLQAPPWVQAILALAMVVGFVVAGKGGMMGIIESISQFANVASYLRIMAVGLAGAIFADAVNQLAVSMGVAAGIVIGSLLHALNFVIAAFSPNIHALRLNFLEFFGKFYEEGKQEYKPFQKTGGEKSA